MRFADRRLVKSRPHPLNRELVRSGLAIESLGGWELIDLGMLARQVSTKSTGGGGSRFLCHFRSYADSARAPGCPEDFVSRPLQAGCRKNWNLSLFGNA